MYPERRNPGPDWGFRVIRFWQKILPTPICRFVAWSLSGFSVLLMPRARRYSREYLSMVLERPAGWREVWRHFFTFTLYLLERLSLWSPPALHQYRYFSSNSHGLPFLRLIKKGSPFLAGTFHVGYSELLGFMISLHHGKMSMVRLKVGNNDDTSRITRNFRSTMEIIWANDPGEMLFSLKDALDRDRSLVMACDRIEFSSKTTDLQFLGARRRFPFTLYHLGIIYQRPVFLVYALPDPLRNKHLIATASPAFLPSPHLSRNQQLALAKEHFQAFLSQLEESLRKEPFYWFNFEPVNPVVEQGKPEKAASK